MKKKIIINDELVDNFISACRFMNCGSDKQLNICGFKIIVYCKYCDKSGAIYDIQKIKNKNNLENVYDITANQLQGIIKKIIRRMLKVA